jgi:hypothetical protein
MVGVLSNFRAGILLCSQNPSFSENMPSVRSERVPPITSRRRKSIGLPKDPCLIRVIMSRKKCRATQSIFGTYRFGNRHDGFLSRDRSPFRIRTFIDLLKRRRSHCEWVLPCLRYYLEPFRFLNILSRTRIKERETN